MYAVKNRKSNRELSEKEISLQDISNILWCANGINRADTGRKTVPSPMNRQDISVYTVLKDGIYLYDAKKHELVPIVSGDYRKDFWMAPLNLIYVSDTSKLDFLKDRPEEQAMTAGIDAGHCSQNVYLYCAVTNLCVVIRTGFDRAKVASIIGLQPQQLIVAIQTIGYPK
jgi:nitroreductase